MDIYVLDKSFNRVGIIDVMESIVWTDRYNSFGDFELYTAVSLDLLNLLQEDYYLQISKSNHTMIIESIEIKTNIENGNKLVVRGRSLESILDRRIVWTQTLISADVQDGIWQLLLDSFITPTGTNGSTQRKVSNFIFSYNSDPVVTAPTMVGQFVSENVYELVSSLCLNNGLGFKLLLNSSNQFEFSVYAGVDHSYSQSINPFVIFSPEFDNLINSDYFQSGRYRKTWALVFGHETDDGQLYRVNAALGNWPSLQGLDQKEIYVDASYVSRFIEGTTTPIDPTVYSNQLREVGNQVLSKNTKINQFDGMADTTKGFVYGVDFGLGDIVQIENEYGLTGRSRVTEVTISENLSGVTIYPTFGIL